jgi:hypothetical protein
MHELETHLHSWVPRRPSAKLKEELFAQPLARAAGQAAPAEEDTPHFRLSWLAPAALALLVIGVMFNQRNLTALTAGGPSRAIIAVALSNQNAAPWLPGSFARDQNTIPAETFEWTNDSRAHSAIR